MTFAPNSGPTSVATNNIQANPLNEDTNQFLLANLVRSDNFTADHDVVGSLDLARVYRVTPGLGGIFKFGGRFRDKEKYRDENQITHTSSSPVYLKGLLDKQFTATSLFDGRYPFPSGVVDSALARNLIGQPGITGTTSLTAPGADYTANEKVNAGYAMTELSIGERLMLLPGFRYEASSIDYTAPKMQFDGNGDLVSTTNLRGDHTYGNFLPAFHARYRLMENTNIRAAVTRSLARPNYSDIAPFEQTSLVDYTTARRRLRVRFAGQGTCRYLVEARSLPQRIGPMGARMMVIGLRRKNNSPVTGAEPVQVLACHEVGY